MMYKIICIFILLLNGICASAMFEVVLPKPFSIEGELMQALVLAEPEFEEKILYLEILDREQNSIVSKIGKIKDQKCLFNFLIPSIAKSDWHYIIIFTKHKGTREILDYSFSKFLIYDLDANLKELPTFPDQENIPSISGKIDFNPENESLFPIILHPFDLTTIPEKLQVDWKTKTTGDLENCGTSQVLNIQIEENLSKEYVAFYNTKTQNIQGLRKVSDNIYSLTISGTPSAIKGQILSVDAFGMVRIIPGKWMEDKISWPIFDPLPDDIGISPQILSYIDRFEKRLKIMQVFNQNYSSSEENQNSREKDIFYSSAEYIQFKNIEEFIQEVVQVLRYNERKNQFSVLNEDKQYIKRNPLLILNDRVVSNIDEILDYEYKDFLGIEVVRMNDLIRKYFSAFGRNGVVIINVKNPNYPSSSTLLTWDDNNREHLSFEANKGPDFRESFILLNDEKLTDIIGINEKLFERFYFQDGSWKSEKLSIAE